VIRDLYAPGRFLADPVVWSEVFADCDDPTVSVRWTDLRATTVTGRLVAPEALSVTYQARNEGGCDNTSVRLDAGGVVQDTNTSRGVPHGMVLPLAPV
jgi:hypothetical protein